MKVGVCLNAEIALVGIGLSVAVECGLEGSTIEMMTREEEGWIESRGGSGPGTVLVGIRVGEIWVLRMRGTSATDEACGTTTSE